MFYICNCIIVILYIPRHVVRVNKSYLILSIITKNRVMPPSGQKTIYCAFIMYGDQLVLNCVVLPCTFYYISFICNLFKLWPYNLYIINIKRLLQPPSINQLIS